MLRSGQNVLAIHGMNWKHRINDDVLIQAELIGSQFARTAIDVGTRGPLIARTFHDGSWSGPTVVELARPGDADGDGVFDSDDLLRVLAAGKYQDEVDGNSTWQEGDWNGDGDFTSDDVILALAMNPYSVSAAQQAVATVMADESHWGDDLSDRELRKSRKNDPADNPLIGTPLLPRLPSR